MVLVSVSSSSSYLRIHTHTHTKMMTAVGTPIPGPSLIEETEGWRVFHKLDRTFGRPKVYAIFQVGMCPYVCLCLCVCVAMGVAMLGSGISSCALHVYINE